ncbi:MAG: response regulator [Acidobacteria bacterium]|nr:response regulator [Acidobacteriota bacterium]
MVAGRKLLLADDSITIQKVVDLTFADEGMQVTTVSSGARAIEMLEEISPDIVLVDIFMPGMNGYQVCEHIKRDERFRHIPVMLLVGSFEPFDEAEARRVGADDYLTKPFQSIRQLVNRVGALLGRESAEDEAPTKDLSLPVSATAPPAISMSEADLERLTANTAPLSSPTHMAQEAPPAKSGALVEASHTDIVQEDELIEAVPKREFIVAKMETSHQDDSYAQMEETLSNYHAPEKSAAVVVAAAGGGRPLMGARMASAKLSDEALLDLDDVPSSRSAREADDFILDLQDEAFAMDAETLGEYQEALTAGGGEAAAFAEAQMTNDEQRADFALVEEPLIETATASPQMEAESIEPEEAATMDEPPASVAPAQALPVGQITLSQLSPEVIDAIARRAVEQISERVVEQVAWEVVPELAELLIKRHLERERAQTP